MRPQKVRVMCAAEHPEICSRVKEVLEAEQGAEMVGQAVDGFDALTLAKQLKPDVAVIDSHLPHSVELDAMRLPRVDGFDIAQTIFSELPNVRVVVLNRPHDGLVALNGWGTDGSMSFCRESENACIPFSIGRMADEAALLDPIVFARLEARQIAAFMQTRAGRVFDKVFFFGVYGFVGGSVMVMSFLFAPIGVFVVLGAGVALALGMMGKLAARILRRRSGGA